MQVACAATEVRKLRDATEPDRRHHAAVGLERSERWYVNAITRGSIGPLDSRFRRNDEWGLMSCAELQPGDADHDREDQEDADGCRRLGEPHHADDHRADRGRPKSNRNGEGNGY